MPELTGQADFRGYSQWSENFILAILVAASAGTFDLLVSANLDKHGSSKQQPTYRYSSCAKQYQHGILFPARR